MSCIAISLACRTKKSFFTFTIQDINDLLISYLFYDYYHKTNSVCLVSISILLSLQDKL